MGDLEPRSEERERERERGYVGDLEKLGGYLVDLKMVRSFFLLLMPPLVAYVNFQNYLVCLRKFFHIDLRKLYSERLSYKISYKVFPLKSSNFFLVEHCFIAKTFCKNVFSIFSCLDINFFIFCTI